MFEVPETNPVRKAKRYPENARPLVHTMPYAMPTLPMPKRKKTRKRKKENSTGHAPSSMLQVPAYTTPI